MQSYLQTRNGRSAFFHRALFDAARNRYELTDELARAGHAAIASALSLAWITKRDTYAMAERLHHLVEAQDWDGVLELLRDHAGLAEVLNEPDGARRFALDVDFAYERAPPDVAALIVSAFLALLSFQPAREAGLDLTHVNAWLIYRPKAAFLHAVLEAGAHLSRDLLALTPEERELAVSSRIRLGGLFRREGKPHIVGLSMGGLVQAEATLLSVLAAAGLRAAAPPRAIGRLAVRLRGLFRRADKRASTIAYELGYIEFLRGELALARRWFQHAYAFGLAARDPTGAWIARCLAENSTFVASQRTRVFEKTLIRAHHIFEPNALQGDPNAQRWLMNVALHRLEVAVVRDDANAARQMHTALLSDAWVRQISPPNFMLRPNALLAIVERRFADAAAAFGQFIGDQSFTSDNRYEQLARHVLDYGRALLASGDRNRAVNVWQAALALPAHAGNVPWQQRIRTALANSA
jgi:hypothetical protein